MIKLYLYTKTQPRQELNFDKTAVYLGRVPENDLVLPHAVVSKKHACFIQKGDKVYIQDLKSSNGTFVNGKKISAPQAITSLDKVAIGEFWLQLAEEVSVITGMPQPTATVAAPPVKPVEKPVAKPMEKPPLPKKPPEEKTPSKITATAPPVRPAVSPESQKLTEVKRQIHKRLIESLDLRRSDIRKLADKDLYKKTGDNIRQILEEMQGDIPGNVNIDALVKEILDEALGLGPLEDLLTNPDISEIMVNGKDRIYVERRGKLELSGKTFSSDEAVLSIIERIVSPLGRRIDESSPLVDARLKDGSRVNAIIPPLALKGPTITIRKFFKDPLKIHDLVRFGTLSPEMAEFLKLCVEARQNIVISGGTGSGKTTTLNILSSFIPTDERIVTIEDAAELQLPQDHVVSLESRPPNIEGKGAILIRDLVRNALRMRPDRIVVGECRGGEALDMLQAMNTGHDGSLTTAHANAPRDALSRLETMVMMSGMELPLRAIREQIASAVNVVVQQSRLSCGSRKVTHICEISGMEGDIITMQEIFVFKPSGFDENGKTVGRFEATGFIPKFYEDLRRRGIPVNLGIFETERDKLAAGRK
ncbi:MAG: Flp pilus assembly complex ATPase component TadA [Candidatus Schekmanbacteria bacterium]|nr:Flp pilus assembly complex ATPase component TadA [Candidatus Schekmanbacteria bacterium]